MINKKFLVFIAFGIMFFLLSACNADLNVLQETSETVDLNTLQDTDETEEKSDLSVLQETYETEDESEEIHHPLNPLNAPLFDRFFDGETWDIELLGMIPEENIYLYGTHEGIMLYYKSHIIYLDWIWARGRGMVPEMMYRDLDGDGIKELATIAYAGSGTDMSWFDLHVFAIQDDETDNMTYTIHSLSDENMREWFNPDMYAEGYESDLRIRFVFEGEEHIIDNHVTNFDNWTEGAFRRLGYGNVIYFSFEDGQIKTRVPIGAVYESEYWIPFYFGDIEAFVGFDGENFSLYEYSFIVYP